MRKQGNTRINISSKGSEAFDMLHVETFMRLLLDWLRFGRGIQTWRYMRKQGNTRINISSKGSEAFDMLHVEIFMVYS